MTRLLRVILGYCPQCRRYFRYPKRRHMNTQYPNEEANYCTVCAECFEEIQDYWREAWRDYYASVL